MTNDPKNSADLVGHVLDATSRLAKSRRRLMATLILVLLVIIAVLGVYVGELRSGNTRKDATITSDQATIVALQKKSAEQTTAEIQLRQDVNSFKSLNAALGANHSKSLAVFCTIARSPFLGVASSDIIQKDCP